MENKQFVALNKASYLKMCGIWVNAVNKNKFRQQQLENNQKALVAWCEERR